MGKSPGKWVKTLIFGKKSSRLKNPKAKDKKRGDDKEVPVCLDQIGNTDPSLSIIQRSEGNIEDDLQSDDSQHEVRTPVTVNQDLCIAAAATELEAQNGSSRIRQEQAAIQMQAALRGYLVRCTFRTLKGIIRLQALVRGHLVRRQAASTLYCMFQIVKFQALARGRKIRNSDIGSEVQKRCTQVNHLVLHSVPVNSSMQIAKLSPNGFARKILTSSSTVVPLHFQYDSNEKNSVLSWLERWSSSYFWQPLPKPIAEHRSKPQKRNIHKSSGTNVESIASEFDKPIRNLRKVSANEPATFVQENPELVLERIKRNLRKVHNPFLEITVQTDTEAEMKSTTDDTEKITSELPERSPEPLNVSGIETVITRGNEKEGENIPEEDPMRKETKKSRRRVSLPMKQEFVENNEPPQTKCSVPSYMAATESARAKLRGLDCPETPGLTRRHSLPPLTNAKTSVSLRVQRQVQTTGKVKNDRSLQLSREGNVKVNQADWRR